MRILLTIILTTIFSSVQLTEASAQSDTTLWAAKKHIINSQYSDVHREYWVSLPMFYDSTKTYPVIYITDAEWRFDLVRNLAWDLSGNKKIPGHIIVGIPHIEWEHQRSKDFTFSHSRIEYDGERVDSTWWNEGNSGQGMKFYEYLTRELVPDVDRRYPTNGDNVFIGHSLGGHFAAYALFNSNIFNRLQIYDPSMWYGEGEALNGLMRRSSYLQNKNIFIAYQKGPAYHAEKIEELIKMLSHEPHITFNYKVYEGETHNSLFMYAFLDGMLMAYPDFNKGDKDEEN